MKKLIILIALSVCSCMPNYSNGDRSGVVTKFSRKGILFKSWEGSLNQGGMKSMSTSDGESQIVANTFEFNASDPFIVEKIKQAQERGEQVTLSYRQYLISPFWIESDYVIIGIK